MLLANIGWKGKGLVYSKKGQFQTDWVFFLKDIRKCFESPSRYSLFTNTVSLKRNVSTLQALSEAGQINME